MNRFNFRTDTKSERYCDEIIRKMMNIFSISENEAVGRMNMLWDGLEIVGEDDLIYHEDVEYWVNTIYYGKDSNWWMNPPNLKPIPYP